MKNNDHPHISNHLMLARRRRGLSRKQVAAILGYQATSTLAKIEAGKLIPPLPILLMLEILYHTPLGNLYPNLYASLREAVRKAEAAFIRVSEAVEETAYAY